MAIRDRFRRWSNLDAENSLDRLTDDIAEGLLSDGLIASVNRGIGRNLQGVTTSAACATSLVSASYACDMIDFGIADTVLLVAVDTLSRVATVAFNNIGAMSQSGCTPYSSGRDAPRWVKGQWLYCWRVRAF
ncbi:3-oxoacyl-(acyl carrier protein) synthase I [Escherichia coli]|nr:3-oxoacyl-(acyl carrier protein) synthase I [Escherichia coli]